jgi:hypothetical protein
VVARDARAVGRGELEDALSPDPRAGVLQVDEAAAVDACARDSGTPET